MRFNQMFIALSSGIRLLACRAFHAETLLAKELFRANIKFTIVNPATVEGRDLVGWQRFEFANHDAPMISVPRDELSKLEFFNDEMLMHYLARREVVVHPGRPAAFTPVDYVNDWCDRFERTGVAVILPRYIELFVRPENVPAFVLAGQAQELVIRRRLDTELFNDFVDALKSNRPTIVRHIRHIDFLPAFIRIFTVKIGS